MKKLIEVSYEGELRTIIVEGDHRYSGPFFESIAILIAEDREGIKKWHCMHNKFHWDDGSISRFSLLFEEMLAFVEQEEKVRLTDGEVEKIVEKIVEVPVEKEVVNVVSEVVNEEVPLTTETLTAFHAIFVGYCRD